MTQAAAGAVGVIGGTGFIGRRLVAHLAAEGTPVVVITPEAPAAALPAGARWISADVRDATTLTAAVAGLPVVYNLAGAHGLESQPRAVFEALNVAAAHQVADAAARASVRHLVFTSTARVYGNAVRPAEDAACGQLAFEALGMTGEFRLRDGAFEDRLQNAGLGGFFEIPESAGFADDFHCFLYAAEGGENDGRRGVALGGEAFE